MTDKCDCCAQEEADVDQNADATVQCSQLLQGNELEVCCVITCE